MIEDDVRELVDAFYRRLEQYAPPPQIEADKAELRAMIMDLLGRQLNLHYF